MSGLVWHRTAGPGPGAYVAGAYTVGRAYGEWYACGPGVDQCYPTKRAAQEACARANG